MTRAFTERPFERRLNKPDRDRKLAEYTKTLQATVGVQKVQDLKGELGEELESLHDEMVKLKAHYCEKKRWLSALDVMEILDRRIQSIMAKLEQPL